MSDHARKFGDCHFIYPNRYQLSLDASIDWLLRSIRCGHGGSAGYFSLWRGWSRPYPETTGYIIPTLFSYAELTGKEETRRIAFELGHWLRSIQEKDGYWHGGLHPPDSQNPSVFNTSQIVLGMISLYRASNNEEWLNSARKGVSWLVTGINSDGVWEHGNYVDGYSPSYYSLVAWSILEVWSITGDEIFRERASNVLSTILQRCRPNGTIDHWGFRPNQPAFTHTIAYTISGFFESARLLNDWESYGSPVAVALETLYHRAELNRGKLPGIYNNAWEPLGRFTCLTGNAQVAFLLLQQYDRVNDLRLVNAACKLSDVVVNAQNNKHPIEGIRGGISGSQPVWGKYMTLRYPNWAAKFHSDTMIQLIKTISKIQKDILGDA